MAMAATLIRRGAAQFGDRVAVYFEDKTMTFAEVDQATNRIAANLAAAGIAKGTRIALLVGNGLWSIPIDFATMKSGIVRVPLNARLSVEEHERMLTEADCQVLVHDAALSERAHELAGRRPGLRLFGLGANDEGDEAELLDGLDEPAPEPDIVIEPEDPCLMLYTSGTTGVLKAVIHTQASYGAICSNILANLVNPQRDSVMLHAASLIHASGTFVLPYWVRGGAAAVLSGFEPAGYFAAIKNYRATELNLVPTMIGMLVNSPEATEADMSSVRAVIYGASPMPPAILRSARQAWGPILVQYYGQSEAPLCIAVLTAEDHDDETLWGACGQPAVDLDLRIADEAGQPVAPGEIGEIVLRAPFRMAGYFRADDLNAEMTTADGWLRSRDMGRIDERGYLHLVDRRSDMIITGGYNVYPREVEDALSEHPAVLECAVVGAPDEKWVEAVTAFVLLRDGHQASEQEIIDFVRGRIAAHKAPKSVHFVETIPKSAVGKILRRALREPLWIGK